MSKIKVVLVLESDAEFLRRLCPPLEHAGVETAIAETFSSALGAFMRYDFAVVLINPRLECSAEAACCFLTFLKQSRFQGEVIFVDVPEDWRRPLQERVTAREFKKTEVDELIKYLINTEAVSGKNENDFAG